MSGGDVELKVKAIDDASATVDRINGKLGGLSQTSGKLGKVMKTGLKVGALAGAAAIAAGGAAAIKAVGKYAEFEQAIANTGAVSNASAQQLANLSDSAKEMGRTTKFTAKESADAMSFLAMAGFKVEETIGALPGVLQLAAAGNMDLASTADIASNILTGYGKGVEELGQVNDVLVGTLTKTNTNLTQLGDAMKYAAPVAKSAGVQFETAAAAIGLMGNAGIQGSMAGTSLRGAISKLLLPTDKAAEAMQNLGMNALDSSGKLLPFEEIVRQLEETGASTADMMQIFGLRAGPAMAALVSQGSDALIELTKELENSGGLAGEIADKQLDTLQGSMTLLKSAVDGAFIALGEGLAPAIRKFADFLTQSVVPAVTEFMEWVGPKLSEAMEGTGSQLGTWAKEILPSLKSLLASAGELFSKLYEAAKPLIPLFAELAKVQMAVLIEALATIADVVADHPELIYAIVGAWAAWKIAGLVSKIGTLVTAVRGLSLSFMGPVGLIAAVGLGALMLGRFIDKNRDAIDKVPVLGGMVSAGARYQRELNDALDRANDLYRRQLIDVDELAKRGLKALGKSLTTLTDEYNEQGQRVGPWAFLNEQAWEGYLFTVTDTVKEMQVQGADLETIYDALETAAIDWKGTTIEDALRPMERAAAKALGERGIGGEIGNLLRRYEEDTPKMIKATQDLADETEEDWAAVAEAYKDLIPEVGQSLQEWREELEVMFTAQVAFDSNLRALYKELAAAGVENVGAIVRTVEEGGPLAAQAAYDMLAEGTAGLESYRLLGEHITVAEQYTGGIVGSIERERATVGQEMVAFAEAMIDAFSLTLFGPKTQEAVEAVNYMTDEIWLALHGSPHFRTWHWGQEMAEDLAEGLITGLGQQEQDVSTFLGQWAAVMAEQFAQGGQLAASLYASQLNSMLQAEYPGIADQVGQMYEDLLAVSGVKGGEAGEAGGSALAAGIGTGAAKFVGQWAATFAEIYAQGGELAAKMYVAQLNSMLQAEYPLVADQLAVMFDDLLYINEDRGEEAGKAGGSRMLEGLGGEVRRTAGSMGQNVGAAIGGALGYWAGSSKAGAWGESIAGYTMAGIWRGFNNEWAGWARAIADIIYEGLMDALDAHSPAKKMIPLGVMAAQGYAQGFQGALTGLALSSPALTAAGGVTGASGPLRGGPGGIHVEPHLEGIFLEDTRQAEALGEAVVEYIERRFG